MAHEHDFKSFPELTNSQMQEFYFSSPHKQITEDFRAKVIKVTDGDTIRVETDFRDFNFPIRFIDSDAPELPSPEGVASQRWLEEFIGGEEVDVIMSQNRVDKWGRLLGRIVFNGIDVNDDSIRSGFALPFGRRREGSIPDFGKYLEAIHGA